MERQAALIALAMGAEFDEDLPNTDDAVSRLNDALFDTALTPEQVDPERVGLRRALNLPDVAALPRRR